MPTPPPKVSGPGVYERLAPHRRRELQELATRGLEQRRESRPPNSSDGVDEVLWPVVRLQEDLVKRMDEVEPDVAKLVYAQGFRGRVDVKQLGATMGAMSPVFGLMLWALGAFVDGRVAAGVEKITKKQDEMSALVERRQTTQDMRIEGVTKMAQDHTGRIESLGGRLATMEGVLSVTRRKR